MVKTELPKYLREGVRSDKSLSQIRKEALAAEKWEKAKKREKRVREFKKKYLSWVPNFHWSVIVKFVVCILAIPLFSLVGALGIVALPIALFIGFFQSSDGIWPWELGD